MSRTNNIKTCRRDMGITQAELADKIGVTQATISQIESGVRPISEYLAEKIETVLECQLNVSPIDILIKKLHCISPKALEAVDAIVSEMPRTTSRRKASAKGLEQ